MWRLAHGMLEVLSGWLFEVAHESRVVLRFQFGAAMVAHPTTNNPTVSLHPQTSGEIHPSET
jgi:hypothetical protein